MTRVAGILLAAGEGSRLGQPKALVELAGQTLAERGVAMLRDGGTDPILLVTGAVRASADGAWIVRNLDWRSGMGSSLAAGLHALDDDPAAGAARRHDRGRRHRARRPAACRGAGRCAG